MATPKVTTASDAPAMSMAELLALHPWAPEYAGTKKIERLWVFDLPGKPGELWPFISDTSRMNRALGTAEMTFREKDGKRLGTAKNGGVLHEWLEVPWTWIAEQWLTCTRIYERGFMTVMYAVHHLEPTARGTRLYLYFGAIARGVFGSTMLRLGFPVLEKAYRRVLPGLAAQLDRVRPDVFVMPPPELGPDAVARLASARAALIEEGMPVVTVDRLLDWVATGDDADLHRIQIRERAQAWRIDEHELLRVALYATRAGILDLSWDTVCPHCRGVRDENSALASLKAEARCEACEVDFKTDTQEAVEVTFKVHPSVREVPDRLYCSAEPATKDHIRVRHRLGAGGRATITPLLTPGRYAARCGKQPGWYLDVHAEGPAALAWADHPEGQAVSSGPAPTITLHNPGSEPETFTIERATWSDHALRPGMLLSFQEFRDLFSEEYIGADVKLAVGEQTVLFTDVVGSTAFYVLRGDPAAFVEIKRHFDEVFAIVREHRGAVVKTIGDAVMATFVNPLDAVKASHRIHDTFHPKREDTPIRLRISLNTGPCIAVRLNSNADFFGGTVNIAAKLQALAEGYQIALSEITYNAPGVAAYLAAHGDNIIQTTYESKALKTSVQARQWTVHRES